MFLSGKAVLSSLWIFILLGTGVLTLKVDVKPKKSLFQLGDTGELRCCVEGCPVEPSFSWRLLDDRPLAASVRSQGHESLVLFEEVIMEHEASFLCIVTCGSETKQASAVVKVYSFPKDPVISGHDNIVPGQENTLKCTVADVYPAYYLNIEWQNGQEEPLLDEDLNTDSSTVSSTYTFIPTAEDAGHSITCRATLDFPEMPQKSRAREATVVKTVVAHPLELEVMQREIVAAKGSDVVLTCKATGCPEPALLWRSALDKPLRTQTQTQGPVAQLLLGAVDLPDEMAYVCEAKCGSVVESKRVEVKVFSFPEDPLIENSGSYLEGEEAILRCTVPNVYPSERLTIQWLVGDRELKTEVGQYSSRLENVTSTLTHRMGPEDEGALVTCRATLEIQEQVVVEPREASTTLRLNYAPRGTSMVVSPSEVKEGENVTISCISDAAPLGRLVLRRVGEEQEDTELAASDSSSSISYTISSATLTDTGVYQCEASNLYGSGRVEAEVTIKAPPRNTTVLIYPSTKVQEGQNITVCCRSVSFPPPAVVLKKLSNGTEFYSPDGTFQLVNLTPNDTGLYQVNVTNDLGYETEIFTINVMEKSTSPSPDLNSIVIPIVCGCVAVGTLAMVLEYVRRSRKKGFYALAQSSPGTA